MSVQELKKRDWVINKDTGLIFPTHSLMMTNLSLAPYSPTDEEIIAGRSLTAPRPIVAPAEPDSAPEIDIVDRVEAITAAVRSIPVEDYSAPAGGRPAMPKIGEVRLISGYPDATVAEVIAALPEGA